MKSATSVLRTLPPQVIKNFLSSIQKQGCSFEEIDTWLANLRREECDKPVIYIGAGTCGLAAGAKAIEVKILEWLKENSVDAQVIRVGCIGLCFAEPLVDIQMPGKPRLCYAKQSAKKIDSLLSQVFAGAIPFDNFLGQFDSENPLANIPFLNDHPFLKKQTRCVLENCGHISPLSIHEAFATGTWQSFLKVIHTMTPMDVCNEVEKSGLRGRGGGGFLTGKKWKFALGADCETKYFICNADEGDPGAFMDRAVIEGDPHRLLEGLAIAAYSIGANKAYVYIRAEYPLAIEHLQKAIEEAKEYGLLGLNIQDSGFDLEIVIKKGAGAFVCGEETALIHSIEGKRGMPRPRPPYPASRGLFDKPTIINNVETLANVPSIIAKGPQWYAAMGTQTSRGTKVFALSGKVKRAGLVEIPMGMPLKEIVFDIGGGIENDRAFKAVQIGGPSGGCVPASHIEIPVDYESLKTVGAMVGSGGLVVMDETTCMVDVARFFMDFIKRESCGKCIPCREGTRVMLEILESLTKKESGEKGASLSRFQGVMHLERLAEVIRTTSLCGLGQTAPNPVLSTLRWFRDEYEAHLYERRCPAGVCQELLSYQIDEGSCKGCTICAKKCPVGAISGDIRKPHSIDQEKCIHCGACYQACRLGAIRVA